MQDSEGKCVTNEDECNKIIAEHFKEHLNPLDEPSIQPFIGEPKPIKLNEIINQQRV